MNLLSLVGPRLDNIYQIRRKWYYSSGCKNLQSDQGLGLVDMSSDLVIDDVLVNTSSLIYGKFVNLVIY